MTAIAATVQLFFTDRLISERGASPATVTAYRDTIRLLLGHASEVTGTAAAKLDFSQLDATVISGFLQHLETRRGNSIRTRNARLAAIRSLFTYAARRHPEHAGDIARVLAIGPKRAAHAVITYLSDAELTALIGTCHPGTVTGRRDRVMIHLAAQTGLRAAELLTLTPADLHLDHGAHVSCRGKGRKNRITPLTPDTIGLLRGWLPGRPAPGSAALFTTSTGTPLSRDAFADRLALHAAAAANDCPSLAGKKISPHVLRHTAAMRLLHSGVDIAVIALWLGHESLTTTAIYLKADLETKERAIARTAPIGTPPGRFQPGDALLAFLDAL
jgi:site-specific recombinase XerD